MGSLNTVTVLGRIGQDIELRVLPSGGHAVELSVATDESYKPKDGEKVELTEWHRIVFWNKQAEVVAKFFKKGSQILVQGSLKTEKYTDKDGVEKYATKIQGRSFEFIDKKEGGQAPHAGGNGIPLDANGNEIDVPF